MKRDIYLKFARFINKNYYKYREDHNFYKGKVYWLAFADFDVVLKSN